MMIVRILMVDDEAHVLSALTRIMRRELGADVLVEACVSAKRALERAREASFDVVLSDYRMPEMDGLAFLLKFRELQPDSSRIILSGMTDFDVLMTAINEVGISRFLPKPWDDLELAAAVREAVAATQQKRAQLTLVDEQRASTDPAYRDALARRELAQAEPGILHVNWGPNGEVLLEGDTPGEAPGKP
jgi:two-component system, probable response regulator PhcQ